MVIIADHLKMAKAPQIFKTHYNADKNVSRNVYIKRCLQKCKSPALTTQKMWERFTRLGIEEDYV